jgi:hypothetical protein
MNEPYIATTREPIRLFTDRGIGVAAGIGGPLPAAYLIAKNFKSLGKERAANATLIIGAAITVALFTILASLPPSAIDKIPPPLIPLAYGLVGYFVVKTLQQRDIDVHLQAGGKKGSWRVISVAGVIGLGLTVGYVLLLTFLSPSSFRMFDGAPYKFERTGATLYYDKANIPEADVKFVGNELEAMGYFSKENPLSAAFRKEGETYTVELIVDEKNWDASFVQHDISQFLRVLRSWHHDSEFQVRLVAIDLVGERKTKIFSEQ